MTRARRPSAAATVALLGWLLAPLPSSAQLATYRPVTAERLTRPEPANWLFYRGTQNGWGYSPLDQVNTANVADLRPVWTLSTGVTGGHEAVPIVNDGVMFVTTPRNQVLAIEAATGDLLWRYAHELPEGLVALHDTNRGVALWGDKVYTATLDARVVALDARTGNVVWNAAVQDNASGYYMTLAPLAADGKIMVGVSGGELGIRGFVVALDAETGREVWRTYTVPAPGEPGNDTWPGDSW
jgi:alcohol dehydrogenase (cytochrome c)